MSNAELDNLIDAYLSGELDDAGRQRLAVLLESDRDVRRAFDEAVHLESLLLAAHADEGAEARAIEDLTQRLQRANPAPAQRRQSGANKLPGRISGPNKIPTPINKPALVHRTSRSQRPVQLPKRSSINAWTALAASIAILFGLAFYFIYDPGTSGKTDKSAVNPKKDEIKKPDDKKGDVKNVAYSVASGSVLIDGKETKDIAEDAWLTVPSSGPASLRAKDGTSVTLDAGTRALLRNRGATLITGSGRFGVKSGADAFVLKTPLGTVNSDMGEFEARLEPALSVTVASGSAQVEINGKVSKLAAGESRIFAAEKPKVKGNDGRGPEPFGPKIRPPEQAALEAILDHEKELLLTADQKTKLDDAALKMNEANAKLLKDEKMKQLMEKQRLADAAHDKESADAVRKEICDRKEEILGVRPFNNPMDILNETQRRIIEPLLPEHPKGPKGNGDEPPHPPPPRPPFPPPPPPGKDGKPPQP